jgi:hypothetical protein
MLLGFKLSMSGIDRTVTPDIPPTKRHPKDDRQ